MSERYYEVYNSWLTDEAFDEETRAELRAIKGNEAEIEDRFFRELEFGTAGMRGILGAGTNRMNLYTVGKVTQSLCEMLLDAAGKDDGRTTGGDMDEGRTSAGDGKEGRTSAGGKPGVAIAYDPRYGSADFAEECARIVTANGIHAYLFDDIRPTPVLSFAVRHLGCAAGIMITASHNPSQYNGYKVYGADGAQMSAEDSERLAYYASRNKGYSSIKRLNISEAYKAGLLTIIGTRVDDVYVEKVKSLSLRLGQLPAETLADFKIVYTPLHGTGNVLVRRVLEENGFKNVIVVPEQELPDPEFSTVKSPNPENRNAFDLAIELAKRENVDIIIGTDPDCDRIGVVFRNFDGGYEVLTGNQIGCLLLDYILSARESAGTLDKERAFTIKSIVTTKLANMIAAHYGVAMREVYTGFKYICKTVKDEDEFGDGEFIFGFEESNGYLAGTFVRDKDGVIASMLVAEMAAWYLTQGMTLAGAMKDIYARYGYAADDVVSYTLEGKEGVIKIDNAMKRLREERPSAFGRFAVDTCKDYQTFEIFKEGVGVTGRLSMPEKSNVLAYQVADGSVFQVRPSGTEPKIKIYFGVTDSTREGAQKLLSDLMGDVESVIKPLLQM